MLPDPQFGGRGDHRAEPGARVKHPESVAGGAVLDVARLKIDLQDHFGSNIYHHLVFFGYKLRSRPDFQSEFLFTFFGASD